MTRPSSAPGFPWKALLVDGACIAAIWPAFFRRERGARLSLARSILGHLGDRALAARGRADGGCRAGPGGAARGCCLVARPGPLGVTRRRGALGAWAPSPRVRSRSGSPRDVTSRAGPRARRSSPRWGLRDGGSRTAGSFRAWPRLRSRAGRARRRSGLGSRSARWAGGRATSCRVSIRRSTGALRRDVCSGRRARDGPSRERTSADGSPGRGRGGRVGSRRRRSSAAWRRVAWPRARGQRALGPRCEHCARARRARARRWAAPGIRRPRRLEPVVPARRRRRRAAPGRGRAVARLDRARRRAHLRSTRCAPITSSAYGYARADDAQPRRARRARARVFDERVLPDAAHVVLASRR